MGEEEIWIMPSNISLFLLVLVKKDVINYWLGATHKQKLPGPNVECERRQRILITDGSAPEGSRAV